MRQQLSFKAGDYIMRYYRKGAVGNDLLHKAFSLEYVEDVQNDQIFIKGIELYLAKRTKDGSYYVDVIRMRENNKYMTSIHDMSPVDFFVLSEDEANMIFSEYL